VTLLFYSFIKTAGYIIIKMIFDTMKSFALYIITFLNDLHNSIRDQFKWIHFNSIHSTGFINVQAMLKKK